GPWATTCASCPATAPCPPSATSGTAIRSWWIDPGRGPKSHNAKTRRAQREGDRLSAMAPLGTPTVHGTNPGHGTGHALSSFAPLAAFALKHRRVVPTPRKLMAHP